MAQSTGSIHSFIDYIRGLLAPFCAGGAGADVLVRLHLPVFPKTLTLDRDVKIIELYGRKFVENCIYGCECVASVEHLQSKSKTIQHNATDIKHTRKCMYRDVV